MNLADEMQYVSDKTVATIGGVGSVSVIVPIQLVDNIAAVTAAFDYLAAVANHIYYIRDIRLYETVAMTGSPRLESYTFGAVIKILINPALQAPRAMQWKDFLCTRLAHVPGLTGNYSIVYNGYDMTYAAP